MTISEAIQAWINCVNPEPEIILLKNGIEYIPAGKGPLYDMKDISPTNQEEVKKLGIRYGRREGPLRSTSSRDRSLGVTPFTRRG